MRLSMVFPAERGMRFSSPLPVGRKLTFNAPSGEPLGEAEVVGSSLTTEGALEVTVEVPDGVGSEFFADQLGFKPANEGVNVVNDDSRAVSAQYPVACPVCGAAPSRPCKTRATGRTTDTHQARIDANAANTTARALDRRPDHTEER